MRLATAAPTRWAPRSTAATARAGAAAAGQFLEVTLFGNPVSASMRARLRGIPGLDLGEKGVSPRQAGRDRRGTRRTAAARRTATTALPPDWGRRADGVYYSKVTGAISYTRPGPDPDEPVYAGGGAWEEWAADDSTPYFTTARRARRRGSGRWASE